MVTGVRHRVTFWAVCYKTHFISCAAPVFYVPLHLDKILKYIFVGSPAVKFANY